MGGPLIKGKKRRIEGDLTPFAGRRPQRKEKPDWRFRVRNGETGGTMRRKRLGRGVVTLVGSSHVKMVEEKAALSRTTRGKEIWRGKIYCGKASKGDTHARPRGRNAKRYYEIQKIRGKKSKLPSVRRECWPVENIVVGNGLGAQKEKPRKPTR